jgi:hypothetical protein
MTLTELVAKIGESPIGTAVAESTFLFPVIECVHVVAITFVAGTIAMVDLRLIGVSARNHAVTKLTNEILPWTWSAFVLAVISGGALFSSNADKYFVNGPFRFKMLCMALAAVNMVIFHFVTEKSVKQWDEGVPTPMAAKVAGVLSLFFWALVIAFGRWIGFTLGA